MNLIFKQSFFNHVTLFLGTVVTLILSIVLSATYSWSIQYLGAVPLGIFSIPLYLPMFGIFPVILVVLLLRESLNKKLILSDDYIIYIEGLAQWKERSVRIDYKNIREIVIEQTLLQKLFNIGDILVTTLATHLDSSVLMPGVKNPRHIKDLIHDRIKRDVE